MELRRTIPCHHDAVKARDREKWKKIRPSRRLQFLYGDIAVKDGDDSIWCRANDECSRHWFFKSKLVNDGEVTVVCGFVVCALLHLGGVRA